MAPAPLPTPKPRRRGSATRSRRFATSIAYYAPRRRRYECHHAAMRCRTSCVSPRPQKERAQKQTPSGSISLDEARRILAAKVRARRDALDGGLRAHSEWVLCRRRLRACRRRPRSRRASSGRRRSSAASNRTLPPSWRTRRTALRSESSEWANTRASASRARPRPRCWRPHRLQPLLLV